MGGRERRKGDRGGRIEASAFARGKKTGADMAAARFPATSKKCINVNVEKGKKVEERIRTNRDICQQMNRKK